MKRKGLAMFLAVTLWITSGSGQLNVCQAAGGTETQVGAVTVSAADVSAEVSAATPAAEPTATAVASTTAGGSAEQNTASTATGSSVTATPAVTAPTTPTVTEIKGGTKRVKLYWKKVSGADGYNIYYSTSLNGTYTKTKTIASASTLKYVKTSLKQNKTYYFKITAYRVSGTQMVESPMTQAYCATTAKVAATSTTGKKYSTKAKFKKSKTYKKYAVLKKANYTRTFAIPGMSNTNVAGFASTKMTAQGGCKAGSYLLVSAYDKTGEDESVIYVINKSTKAYLTTIVMPNKTKLNAMAYDGKRIWVTQGKKVSYFGYDIITQAVGSGDSYYELTAFTETLPILTTGSYMTYYKNVLWIGAYNATASTNAYGYTMSQSADGTITLTQVYYMTMPNRTRALSFDADGYLYLTRSSKRNSTEDGYISQVRTFKPSLSTPSKNGAVKKNLLKKTTMPAMAMGSMVYGNYLYNVFASCQYAKCVYKVDRVVAVKLTKMRP